MAFVRFFLTVRCAATVLVLLVLLGCSPQFSLQVTAAPSEAAGVVVCVPARDAFQRGETILLTAEAQDGWRFDAWEGDYTGKSSSATIVIAKDMRVTARFSKLEGTVPDEEDAPAEDSVADNGEEAFIGEEDADETEDASDDVEDLDEEDAMGDDSGVDTEETPDTPVADDEDAEVETPDASDEEDVDDSTNGDEEASVGCDHDDTAPVITLAGAWVVRLNGCAPYVEAGLESVTDACDGDITLAATNDAALLAVQIWTVASNSYHESTLERVEQDFNELLAFNEQSGAYRIAYQLSDRAGNVGVAERHVIVNCAVPDNNVDEVEDEDESDIPDVGDTLPEITPGDVSELDAFEGDLKDFVALRDGCFGYTQPVKVAYPLTGNTLADIYFINRMRSQCWNPEGYVYDGDEWVHPVVIYVPRYRTGNTALLFIDGGSRSSTANIEAAFVSIALMSGTTVVHVKNIPSQPMVFGDEVIAPGEEDNYSGDDFVLRRRSEDAAIAYSYEKYLARERAGDSGAAAWPLLFPMTRAAVRAMDVAEDVLRGARVPLNGFVVSGASKRGWTTWLTGAVDSRVKAIAPIVINVMNMDVNLTHHRNAYGYWSPAIYDYAQKGVFDQLIPGADGAIVPEALALLDRVDPYRYALAGQYAMPVFMLNATGDEFFVPDLSIEDDSLEVLAAHGEPRMAFVPNVGHGMGGLDGSLDLSDSNTPVGMFMAWYMAVTQNRARPAFEYYFDSDGAIRVVVDANRKPIRARMWRATSRGKRDFRNPVLGPRWSATQLRLQSDGVTYRGRPLDPATDDYTAFFIQLEYANEAQLPPAIAALQMPGMVVPNLMFTTPVRVLPIDDDGAPTYPEFTGYAANSERPDAVLIDEGKLPMAVVYGQPYEMGHYYGQLMADRIDAFVDDYLGEMDATGRAAYTQFWANAEAKMDERILDEIEGIADGSGVELGLLQLAHARALYHFDAFTTSTAAAYRDMLPGRDAMHTVTVNAPPPDKALDEEVNYFHDHLCAVMYVPDQGVPHIVFSYAGLAYGLTGANLAGISISDTLEPGAAGGDSAAPLMRTALYDALSLRDAVEAIAAARPARATTFVIADGRNEKRAARVRLSAQGAIVEERYDLARTDFRVERPGIIYHARTAAARDSLKNLLADKVGNLTRNDMLTIAGTIPTAMTGYNILNVGYEFDNNALNVYIAVARNDQEAYQDYFEQIFMQRLLP